jgi:hypothetical protein
LRTAWLNRHAAGWPTHAAVGVRADLELRDLAELVRWFEHQGAD